MRPKNHKEKKSEEKEIKEDKDKKEEHWPDKLCKCIIIKKDICRHEEPTHTQIHTKKERQTTGFCVCMHACVRVCLCDCMFIHVCVFV
jgi:hypothetical protein